MTWEHHPSIDVNETRRYVYIATVNDGLVCTSVYKWRLRAVCEQFYKTENHDRLLNEFRVWRYPDGGCEPDEIDWVQEGWFCGQ